MSVFGLYFRLGIEHIADIQGYDHILFILTLCTLYAFKDWKKVLVLVTAFTIGHSLTLALATLNLIQIDAPLIEFLIPLTIFLTALSNLLVSRGIATHRAHDLRYAAALFFGLIHGLGFSNYLRSLLGGGKQLAMPLLSFNLGIEVGQILIVGVVLCLAWLVTGPGRFPRREWHVLLAGVGLGISLVLMIERWPWG